MSRLNRTLMAVGALLGVLAPSVALAEIYGWIDPSGDVTYSNMPPPQSARVFDVIKDAPPPSPEALAAVEAAHNTQMEALHNELQRVERELAMQRQMAGPPPSPYDYEPQYAPTSYGPNCDPRYYDCNTWDGPAYYAIGWGWPYAFRRDDFHRRGFHHRFPGRPSTLPSSAGFHSSGGASRAAASQSGHGSVASAGSAGRAH